jgi:pathogenesis-related protein 1
MGSFVLGLVASAGCAALPGVGPTIDDAEAPDAASTTKPSPYTCDIDARVAQAVMGDGSTEDAAGAQNVDPESGRLAGITAAHNAVRATVPAQPPLSPLTWCQTIADYAQQWATSLAMNMCSQPQHRSAIELQGKGYGENLATFASGGLLGLGLSTTAKQAVSGWASEAACWTYGTIGGTEKCDTSCYTNLHSDGCGHYTQIVWRDTTQLGCGVASCNNGALTEDIWVCNYAPPGNFPAQAPY